MPARCLGKTAGTNTRTYTQSGSQNFPNFLENQTVDVYRLLRVFLRLLKNPKPKWIKLGVLRASLCARRRPSTCSTASPNRLTIKTNASASCSHCESACSTRYLSLSLSLWVCKINDLLLLFEDFVARTAMKICGFEVGFDMIMNL